MPLGNTDLFIVERGANKYRLTAAEVAVYLGIPGEETVADIAARDALTGLGAGVKVFVLDATADTTVNAGWAIYRYNGAGYDKIQEQEGLDIVVTATNLAYTPDPAQGTVTNSAGADAIIPAVTATNAGLATPAMFNNAHQAASTDGTAANNPVSIDANQVIGFSISALDPLP